MARKRVYGIHHEDARNIAKVVGKTTVNVTITSPPYFDLKDYGEEDQIGFGQSYEEYLDDLRAVFSEVYSITEDDGSLWVIIDTFRKDGEMVLLPFDLANQLKEVGWKLQEIIIWEKDKTVPWAHHGQLRNIFEYILVFSKRKKFKFEIDRIRDFVNLKKWWVKYPERYNPKGKNPEAIWEFNIPTQGSWGGKYIRHFCPLPDALIEQIILLTTDEKQTVLDVFAGTGAVLSQADAMKRKYIGTEINSDYISKFTSYIDETASGKRKAFKDRSNSEYSRKNFVHTIWSLRTLKFARLIYNSLGNILDGPYTIFASLVQGVDTESKRQSVYLEIFLSEAVSDRAKNHVEDIVARPPLSKFGVDVDLHFNTMNKVLKLTDSKSDLFIYSNKVSHKFLEKLSIKSYSSGNAPAIISPIKLDLNENDY